MSAFGSITETGVLKPAFRNGGYAAVLSIPAALIGAVVFAAATRGESYALLGVSEVSKAGDVIGVVSLCLMAIIHCAAFCAGMWFTATDRVRQGHTEPPAFQAGRFARAVLAATPSFVFVWLAVILIGMFVSTMHGLETQERIGSASSTTVTGLVVGFLFERLARVIHPGLLLVAFITFLYFRFMLSRTVSIYTEFLKNIGFGDYDGERVKQALNDRRQLYVSILTGIHMVFGIAMIMLVPTPVMEAMSAAQSLGSVGDGQFLMAVGMMLVPNIASAALLAFVGALMASIWHDAADTARVRFPETGAAIQPVTSNRPSSATQPSRPVLANQAGRQTFGRRR